MVRTHQEDHADFWGEPKGGWAKGCPLEGCVWRFNAKRKMHLVVGDGTLLVPMWLRGLVQLLTATIVRKNSNSGSMAMVVKILSLMRTTILKYWPRTRNT